MAKRKRHLYLLPRDQWERELKKERRWKRFWSMVILFCYAALIYGCIRGW